MSGIVASWVELDLPSKIFETDISIFTKCTLNVFLTCQNSK